MGRQKKGNAYAKFLVSNLEEDKTEKTDKARALVEQAMNTKSKDFDDSIVNDLRELAWTPPKHEKHSSLCNSKDCNAIHSAVMAFNAYFRKKEDYLDELIDKMDDEDEFTHLQKKVHIIRHPWCHSKKCPATKDIVCRYCAGDRKKSCGAYINPDKSSWWRYIHSSSDMIVLTVKEFTGWFDYFLGTEGIVKIEMCECERTPGARPSLEIEDGGEGRGESSSQSAVSPGSTSTGKGNVTSEGSRRSDELCVDDDYPDANAESVEHEFKECKDVKWLSEYIPKYCSSFLNDSTGVGGTLHLGVRDDGSVNGVPNLCSSKDEDDFVQRLNRLFKEGLRPTPPPDMYKYGFVPVFDKKGARRGAVVKVSVSSRWKLDSKLTFVSLAGSKIYGSCFLRQDRSQMEIKPIDLEDVIELRKRKWVTENQSGAS